MSKGEKPIMPKYVTSISTKHGTVISTTGDNQHVTITKVHTGEERMAPPPVPPTPATAPGSNEEDIITAIGPKAKVTINGKRVL